MSNCPVSGKCSVFRWCNEWHRLCFRQTDRVMHCVFVLVLGLARRVVEDFTFVRFCWATLLTCVSEFSLFSLRVSVETRLVRLFART